MLYPRNILTGFICLLLCLTAQLSSGQCDQDNIPPVIMAPPDMVVSCLDLLNYDLSDPEIRNQLFGEATVTDDCEFTVTEIPNFSGLSTGCNSGMIIRLWQAVDENGNSTVAASNIQVNYESSLQINIPADATPTTSLELLEFLETGCALPALTWEDETFSVDCDGEMDKFIRQFTILDWCAIGNPGSNTPVTLPRLDIDNDGVFGDAYQIQVTPNAAYLIENGVVGDSLAPFSPQYEYLQINDVIENTEAIISVEGMIYQDDDENCELNLGEPGIPNYGVKITNISNGLAFFTTSDAQGNYGIEFCANGDTIEISSNNPFYASGACLSTTTVVLDPGVTVVNLDIPLQIPCGQLLVDIGTWNLRRCFNNKYFVSYQNLNPLSQSDVFIDVELDAFMTYTSSSIPATDLGGNIYRFEIGELAALASGSFSINFDLSCDAVLGQTHCSSAAIFPEIMCDTLSGNWSGASIAISGECLGDSLQVKIENVGASNMLESSDYIIVEDVIMMSINPFQLQAGEMHSFNLPANGATWHVAAEQVPFHPGVSLPSITVEGCNGVNNPGLASGFPQNDADPDYAIDCRINIGSYDPNDKQAAPSGVGAEREIAANVGMEYMIRFQNTGTDTAFTVVIEDELSVFLDANTVRPGAASHPYIFERYEDNKIKFTFNDIMLPDSTVDLEGSNGFVKFNILQLADNAPGTVIHNEAAIYFDFNEPIITNDAFVTISDHPFGVINYLPTISEQSRVAIFPNPTEAVATIVVDFEISEPIQMNIFNINGQLLLSKVINSQETRLELGAWPKGIYPVEWIFDGQLQEVGKIVIQ